MPDKTLTYIRLAQDTARQITSNYRSWTAYLSTASRLYKYQYSDQLLIHAQRPDATACAEYDLWNNTMHRYVRRGSKGIALLHNNAGQLSLRYVFDVADTGTRRTSLEPFLWQINPQNELPIAAMLEHEYGVSAEHGLHFQLAEIAQRQVTAYWQDHQNDAFRIVDGSVLAEYDERDVGTSFRRAASISVCYTLQARCGLDVDSHFEDADFLSVYDWNTPDAVAVLGTAVSQISGQVLRQIETIAKRVERSVENERTDLHDGGRLPASEPDRAESAQPAPEQVRTDEGEVPGGAEADPVSHDAAERNADQPSAGDQRDGEPSSGADDAGAGESGERDGGTEGQRPDGLDTADEQPESAGRGNPAGGADLQLNFFDGSFIPSEAEQIAAINSPSEAFMRFAFFVAQEDVDHILRLGSNTSDHRLILTAEFSKQKPLDEMADSVRRIYHGGYGILGEHGKISAWYAEDGIHIGKGDAIRYRRTAQIISWQDAAQRIGELLDNGQFASNIEVAAALGHERHRLVQSLDFIAGDLAAESREQGYLATLRSFDKGGYPEWNSQTEAALANPETRAVITEEYRTFLTAYRANHGLMRYHYSNMEEIMTRLDDLSLPRRDYDSHMAEVPPVQGFITEDEINASLSRGSNVEGTKGRIYQYFSEPHTPKEQAAFLKDEYGIGGGSRGVAGADKSWYMTDGKGLHLQKPNCEDVHLSWPKVAKRTAELIRQDRFLLPAAKVQQVAMLESNNKTIEISTEAPVGQHTASSESSLETDRTPVKPAASPYLVVTYHHFENGFDAKLDYQTLAEAERAAQGYVDGTMEADGFQYDGAAVYDQQSKQYLRVYGDFPDEKVQAQVAEQSPPMEEPPAEEPQPIITEPPYRAGDVLYLDDQPFVVESVGVFDVHMRDPNAVYPIMRAESKERLAQLLALDKRNAAYLPKDGTVAETEPIPQITPENYRITDDHLGEGGPKEKFKRNVEAIRILKALEADNRPASPAEQEILAQYVGWGGLADAFDERKSTWASENAQIRNLLTKEEYESAMGSVLNAHYTSPTVIRAIYDAVERMGFTRGNILEPSCGVGNFFGMLPDSMQDSRLYGVELDSISGRIARQLYPKANIAVAGFETTDRRDFFDLAIGNVPFGNYKVDDRAYNKLGFSIHNYFIAKMIDQVRPGGVVAVVTSRYTMDQQSPEVRRHLAERAELLGAIRLPNNAFRANAGTDVVSDILFFQKRERPMTIDPDWVHLGENTDGFAINQYFIDHPEMVLGEQTSESTQYGKQDFNVAPREGVTLADQLPDAVQHINGIYVPAALPELAEGEEIRESIPADPSVKNYSYTVVDGQVYFRENSIMVRPDLNQTAQERVKGLVGLRDCAHELIDAQLDEAGDSAIQGLQAELNQRYDAFTAQYGLINSRGNALAFSDDSSYYLLCSLEVLDDQQQLKRKADMFTKRTIKQQRVIDHVDTAVEALTVSISERAGVDLPYMAQLTGKAEDELAQELTGVIFPLPESVGEDRPLRYVTADEYLSGNVRRKLRDAVYAADHDERFLPNVTALESAQPQDLDASELDVRLGATWVNKDYIEQFMYELLDTPYAARHNIHVNYSPHTAEWFISNKNSISSSNIAAYTSFGTSRVSAYKILEDTLNLRDVRVYDIVLDDEGREKRVLNQKATTFAQQKQQAIKDAFRDWVWRDPDRRHDLVQEYNERFNSTRPREFDGSHISFAGMNPEITLREHQRNAVAHILYGGNTLLAHEVGAGKTFEMIAAAMESKRLGLCQKCMFVVPNHLTEQWASEFLRLYPSANILVTTKKDFERHNRQKFCSRIATGDYDAIIIGHSQFERIPVSYARQVQFIEDQIDDVVRGLDELKSSHGEQFTIKQLVRTKKQLEAKLKKLQADSKKDDVVTFEQLGVDRLYVDEAHAFKNRAKRCATSSS